MAEGREPYPRWLGAEDMKYFAIWKLEIPFWCCWPSDKVIPNDESILDKHMLNPLTLIKCGVNFLEQNLFRFFFYEACKEEMWLIIVNAILRISAVFAVRPREEKKKFYKHFPKTLSWYFMNE